MQLSALFYGSEWKEAPFAAETLAFNLMELWKDLRKYKTMDCAIILGARKVLEAHMWYLWDDWLSPIQFSDTVPTKEKAKIIPGMNNPK